MQNHEGLDLRKLNNIVDCKVSVRQLKSKLKKWGFQIYKLNNGVIVTEIY